MEAKGRWRGPASAKFYTASILKSIERSLPAKVKAIPAQVLSGFHIGVPETLTASIQP